MLEAHLSLINIRQSEIAAEQNQVVRRLTLVSTVFLPLTFITGFFGQNFGWLVGARRLFRRVRGVRDRRAARFQSRSCSRGSSAAATSDPQNFFRPGAATFRPRLAAAIYGRLMFDLAALGIAVFCFAFTFFLVWVLGASLMTAGDLIGLVISLLVFAYLVYALFRAERL